MPTQLLMKYEDITFSQVTIVNFRIINTEYRNIGIGIVDKERLN